MTQLHSIIILHFDFWKWGSLWDKRFSLNCNTIN